MGHRILFISESQGWSGGAAQLLALGIGLKAAGWEVILGSPEDGEVAAKARTAGIEHIPLHPRQDYDLLTARRLARLLEEREIEVLHAHHPRAHAVGLAALYLSRRRPVFVVTRRVSFAVPRNPFSRLKYRNPRIDGFVAVAESVRERLLEGGVRPERAVTIPSGVDTAVFAPRPPDPTLRESLGIPPDAPVVADIGNFADWKGQDVFLKAAARLQREGRRAVFVLAGRDTDSPRVRDLLRESGLEAAAVRLLGFWNDVPRLISICAVCVNAARRGEGISGALRESLAMEVPVIASAAGGNPELVREGVTGRLFPPGSDEDLARVLRETLADPAGAKRLAVDGAAVVRDRFSVGAMVARTAELYEKLLAGRAELL